MRLFLFLFLWTINAYSQVVINLGFTAGEVFQGEIVSAKAKIDFGSGAITAPGFLKGQSIADMIFIHELSIPIKQEGESIFLADAQVIFLDIPKASRINGKVNNMDVTINLGEIKINPIEVPENFIMSQFNIPQRTKIMVWLLAGFGLFLVLFSGRSFYIKSKRLAAAKLGKQKFKKLINEASSYEDVVLVWNKKLEILAEFPILAEEFKELEAVLFQIQFKPSQSEAEKHQACEAYKKFKAIVGGRLNGV